MLLDDIVLFRSILETELDIFGRARSEALDVEKPYRNKMLYFALDSLVCSLYGVMRELREVEKLLADN